MSAVKGFHEPDLWGSVLTASLLVFIVIRAAWATGHAGVDGRQDARPERIGKLKSLLQIFLNN
jgi:hypothetical protein